MRRDSRWRRSAYVAMKTTGILTTYASRFNRPTVLFPCLIPSKTTPNTSLCYGLQQPWLTVSWFQRGRIRVLRAPFWWKERLILLRLKPSSKQCKEQTIEYQVKQLPSYSGVLRLTMIWDVASKDILKVGCSSMPWAFRALLKIQCASIFKVILSPWLWRQLLAQAIQALSI